MSIKTASLAAALILSSTLGLSACSRQQSSINGEPIVTAVTPPFSTKEPARYRAVRTITSGASGESHPAKTIIVRDGKMRREEYETTRGETIVLLESPAGIFLLGPSAKVFANLDEGSAAEFHDLLQQNPDTDLSTDRLLNESVVETRYQKIGSEALNGRAATRYRVLTAAEGTETGTETFLWIDDALAMPVRWETTVMAGENRRKTTMELSEISLDVDAKAFVLPNDYRKVDIRVLYGWIPAKQAGPEKK